MSYETSLVNANFVASFEELKKVNKQEQEELLFDETRYGDFCCKTSS